MSETIDKLNDLSERLSHDDYIAHFRTAVPAMASVVDELRSEVLDAACWPEIEAADAALELQEAVEKALEGNDHALETFCQLMKFEEDTQLQVQREVFKAGANLGALLFQVEVYGGR